MDELTIAFKIESPPSWLPIGRTAENNWRTVEIDCSYWFNMDATGNVVLMYRPSCGMSPYPLLTERDGDNIIWRPKSGELVEGVGRLQAFFEVGTDVIGSSDMISCEVDSSLLGADPGTDPGQTDLPWALDIIEQIAELSGHYPKIENGVLYVWDSEQEDWVQFQGGGGNPNAVLYTQQSLTDAQKLQARTNVGAGTYSKPSGGIPKSDLASAVQTSLGKADTALQTAPVTSVNNKTGAVVLDASDVHALPDSTVIPPTVTEQTVSGWGFTKNTGTYSKPSGGIPASDLASGVIPSVPQMATDPDMTDWTSGKTVDAAVLKQGVQYIERTIEGKADASDIPTAVSELTNDSGFVNASEAAAAAPVQSVNGQTGAVTIPTGNPNAVLYTAQSLTPAQQEQARENVGIEFMTAADAEDMWSDADGDIPGTETYGTVEKIKAKLVLKESNNLSRSDADWKTGYYVRNGAGDEVAISGLSCSAMIPVEPGDVIRLFDRYDGAFGGPREMRSVATFAADGTVIPNPDATGWKVRSYTVTGNVRFVRISVPTATNYMITKNYIPTVFEPWFEPYYVATKDFIQDALSGVTAAELKNGFAFAIPQLPFRQTVGLSQTWYKRSMITPRTELVHVCGGQAGTTDHGEYITFGNQSAVSTVNGYLWYAYDPYFNLLQKYDAGTGYGASVKVAAENLQNCTALVIGDSTVSNNGMTRAMLSRFAQNSKTLTLLGTLSESGNPLNRNEGRAGWSTASYLTNTKYNGVVNPFYNPETGTFDFAYYMAQQGYSGADFVVLQLGINDLYPNSPRVTDEPDYAAVWNRLKTMIDSIHAYNGSIRILINLPTAPNSDPSKHSIFGFLYEHFVVRFNAYALDQLRTQYSFSSVRPTYCHLILDPASDIRDNVHPTAAGYEKMALETVSQINCWQNGA